MKRRKSIERIERIEGRKEEGREREGGRQQLKLLRARIRQLRSKVRKENANVTNATKNAFSSALPNALTREPNDIYDFDRMRFLFHS